MEYRNGPQQRWQGGHSRRGLCRVLLWRQRLIVKAGTTDHWEGHEKNAGKRSYGDERRTYVRWFLLEMGYSEIDVYFLALKFARFLPVS